MMHFLSLLGTAVVAFTSTNIDDLVMLIGFYANPTYPRRRIALGQFAGMAALVVLSLAGAMLALVVSAAYIGLMGLVPIVIGVRRLIARNGRDGREGAGLAHAGSQVGTVALVTVSNGADNLSLYIPLFAIHRMGEVAVFVAVFAVMTVLWCLAAYLAVAHPRVAAPLERVGERALPYVMIALGLYILAKTDALTVLGV